MPRKSKCSTAAATLGSCSASKRKSCKKAGKRKAAKKAPKKAGKKKAKKAGKRKAAKKAPKKVAAKKTPANKRSKRKAGNTLLMSTPKLLSSKTLYSPSGTPHRFQVMQAADGSKYGLEADPNRAVRHTVAGLREAYALAKKSGWTSKKAKRKATKKSSRKKKAAPSPKAEVVEKTVTPHPRARKVVEETTVSRPMTQSEFAYYNRLMGGGDN